MKRVIALTGLAFAIGLANMGAQAANYVAGNDYRVLDNPENISGDAIIVREFFWYGCKYVVTGEGATVTKVVDYLVDKVRAEKK